MDPEKVEIYFEGSAAALPLDPPLTEGLVTFETKLTLFAKYPDLTELYRLLP
jgi:hypothetical protein